MIHYITPDPKDPAYQFLIGNPPEIIGATKTPKIMIIGLHGTEHLAARVAHHIQTKRPDLLSHVDYICGNPRAAASVPQERYTNEHGLHGEQGTDLNRSFTRKEAPKTYEEKRAIELTQRLQKYNFVLDLHTTTTTAGSSHRFLLTTHLNNSSVQNIIAASPIERVVVFTPGNGVLNDAVLPSMACEFNQDYAVTPSAISDIIQTIDTLIGNTPATPRQRELFYVSYPILKENDPGIDTPNFELYKNDYYPILVGNNSYRFDPTKKYVGYAATKKEIILL
ncbi:MAG TPA: succinylglutamate desuccinylase/aspartoacylase family protein [Patescibacteria group bacterium]|nr:succinylglutamate desuccinylase/aspartoacylase family protein [Patescibacteria group bacterium]